MGVIGRPHGVRGLVRVTSHTADPADLTAYGPLSDERAAFRAALERRGRRRDRRTGRWRCRVKVADRATAEKLTNTRLFVDRAPCRRRRKTNSTSPT